MLPVRRWRNCSWRWRKRHSLCRCYRVHHGKCKGDEKIGADIVLRSLSSLCGRSPIMLESTDLWSLMRAGQNQSMLVMANKGEYVDMLKSGIIDPVKVTRTALANAASIAGLL